MNETLPALKRRCIVYIDGFNFYYGMVRNTKYKWADLQMLFERIRQNDEVLAINYFTSKAKDSAGQRQDVYFRALKTRPKIKFIYGRFKETHRDCGVRECKFAGNRRFPIEVEKRTDVNIAVQMVGDAYKDAADVFVLVSGDSDLVPALQHVRLNFPKIRLVAYIPARNADRAAATEIREHVDKDSTLDVNLIGRCQLPNPVVGLDGSVIHKPGSW